VSQCTQSPRVGLGTDSVPQLVGWALKVPLDPCSEFASQKFQVRITQLGELVWEGVRQTSITILGWRNDYVLSTHQCHTHTHTHTSVLFSDAKYLRGLLPASSYHLSLSLALFR